VALGLVLTQLRYYQMLADPSLQSETMLGEGIGYSVEFLIGAFYGSMGIPFLYGGLNNLFGGDSR